MSVLWAHLIDSFLEILWFRKLNTEDDIWTGVSVLIWIGFCRFECTFTSHFGMHRVRGTSVFRFITRGFVLASYWIQMYFPYYSGLHLQITDILNWIYLHRCQFLHHRCFIRPVSIFPGRRFYKKEMFFYSHLLKQWKQKLYYNCPNFNNSLL
jgi:hypothetical protein